MESTAVDPDGRITKNDLGLWNNTQAQKLSQLIKLIHSFGSKIGVQLNHAVHSVAPSAIRYNDKIEHPAH